jgi:hypothetical protein
VVAFKAGVGRGHPSFNPDAGTYEETYRSIATGETSFHKTGEIKNQDLLGRRESPPSGAAIEPGM